MFVVLHGVAGGWDELLIALVAFGVMWAAVKLAGRKRVDEEPDSEASIDDVSEATGSEANPESVEPSAPRRPVA